MIAYRVALREIMHATKDARRLEKANAQAYRQQNPEQVKEAKKAHYQRNKEAILLKNKTYRHAHAEQLRIHNKQYRMRPEIRIHRKEFMRAWYQKNAERLQSYTRMYQRAHPEQMKVYSKNWYYAHERSPIIQKLNQQKRRARKALAGGSYTTVEWFDLIAKYDHTCLCCGKRSPEIKLTPDHVIPISQGGTSYIENIQPLCLFCNKSKGQKIIDYRLQDPREKEA